MIKRQQLVNGCQTTILRNKHMTTRSCSRLPLYIPVEESTNTQSHAISAIPPLLPPTHTFDDAGEEVEKKRYHKLV
jgi:hypothetical protein